MKTKTVFYIGIPILAAGLITYFLFFNKPQSLIANVTARQISVYEMHMTGAEFFRAITNQDFSMFTFQNDGSNNYEIKCRSFSGNSFTDITTTTFGNPYPIPPTASPDDFTIASCVLSKMNVIEFLRRIRAAGFDFSDLPHARNFFIDIKVEELYNYEGTWYPKINIRAVNGAGVRSRFANPNPCPPCSFTVYTGES